MTTLFFPESELALWRADGAATISADRLSVIDPVTKRSLDYTVERAAHVAMHLGDANGGARDPFEIVGRVKSEQSLRALGASFEAATVQIESHSYAVVFGLVGKAVDPNADHERILSDVSRRHASTGGAP